MIFPTNPKTQFVVDFNIDEVKIAILRLDKIVPDCPIINNDNILNTIRLHRKGTLDLGYHIDFRLEQSSENKTKIEIEVSRNLGTINTASEVAISNNILKMITEKFSIALSKKDIKDREKYTLEILTKKDKNGDLSFVKSTKGEYLDKELSDFLSKSIEEEKILNSKGFYLKSPGFNTSYRFYVNDQNIHIHKKEYNKYIFTKPVKTKGNLLQRLFKSESREKSNEFSNLEDCINSAIKD